MATTKKTATTAGIPVRFCIFGKNPRNMKVKKAMALGVFKQKMALSSVRVDVNKAQNVADDYIIQPNDTIVAVPEVKDGI